MYSSEWNLSPGYKSQLMLYFPRTTNFARGAGYFVNKGSSTSREDYALMHWAMQKEVRVFHHPSGTTFYSYPPSDDVFYSVGTDGEFYGYREKRAKKTTKLPICSPQSEDPMEDKNKFSSGSVDNDIRGDSALSDSLSNHSGLAPDDKWASCGGPSDIWAHGEKPSDIWTPNERCSDMWSPSGRPLDIWSNFSGAAPGQIWGQSFYPGNTSVWSNHQIITTSNNSQIIDSFHRKPRKPCWGNHSCVAMRSVWKEILSIEQSNAWNNHSSREATNISEEVTCPGAGDSNTLSDPPSVSPEDTVGQGEKTTVKDPLDSSIQNKSVAENAYEPREKRNNPKSDTYRSASGGNTKQRKNKNKNKRRGNKEHNQRAF